MRRKTKKHLQETSTVITFQKHHKITNRQKLVSSKHLIQVHLEILSHSVENMFSHWLTKYIT